MNHAVTIFAVLVVLVLGIVFFARPGQAPVETPMPMTDSGVPTELSQTSCESAGGAWNACGSACRTQPEAVCVEMCVEYCECTSDAQCPAGFVCGDYVDGVGVCL